METKFLLPILLLSLISTPCLSETMGDLVKRDGLYYEKLSKTLFTGKVTGRFQGRLENGKKEGEWVKYHNTKIFSKGSYKNGKREGDWVGYHDNGNVSYRGSYKNGKKEGEWVSD
jgi:antitoxin component YwqK of YwqJK toxin-antitoxin module